MTRNFSVRPDPLCCPLLLIGAGFAALSLFRLRQMAAGVDWLPHVLFNAVIL
jgi:hypothetical protein